MSSKSFIRRRTIHFSVISFSTETISAHICSWIAPFLAVYILQYYLQAFIIPNLISPDMYTAWLIKQMMGSLVQNICMLNLARTEYIARIFAKQEHDSTNIGNVFSLHKCICSWEYDVLVLVLLMTFPGGYLYFFLCIEHFIYDSTLVFVVT